MGSARVMAIDLGRRRFRAVQAVRKWGRESPQTGHRLRRACTLRIKRVLVEDFPADLDMTDPLTVGRWIGERLSTARFSRSKATLAIGREHVAMKRITLPSIDDAELPDMTRLAMQRELPFDAQSAVIDFVRVERSQASTTVVAVAVPQPVIEYAWVVGKAAGLGIERLSLRTMGAAALLNTFHEEDWEIPIVVTSSEAHTSPTPNPQFRIHNSKSDSSLAIDMTGEGMEFCLVANGTIRFSRAAEVPQPQDQLAIADALVTETRRTWMSYRIGEEAGEVSLALVMGDQRVSAYAAEPLAQMLKIPVQTLQSHPCIDISDHIMDWHWPLAGLLLEPALSGELINFARPRKAPDLPAMKRRRRLLAAGLIVAVAGLALSWARHDLRRLEAQTQELTAERARLAPAHFRYGRDLYKLEHLKKWESVGADWLSHASYLAAIAPPPDQVVLDSWTGSLEFHGVAFDSKTLAWSADQQMTLQIDGEARDRETADAFREALVQTSIYTTSSTGADSKGGKRMPFGFTYRLRTKVGSPHEVTVSSPKAESKVESSSRTAGEIGPSADQLLLTSGAAPP